MAGQLRIDLPAITTNDATAPDYGGTRDLCPCAARLSLRDDLRPDFDVQATAG